MSDARHAVQAEADVARRLAAMSRWLAGRLASNDFTLAPASEDASFRRYFRLTARAETFVVMDAPPGKESCRPFVHVAGLLRAAGVNAPEIIHADLAQGFLLLTDLGTDRYLELLPQGDEARLYGDAIGAMLSMQACIPASEVPEYDRRLLDFEMSLFQDWFLTVHLGTELDAPQRSVLGAARELLNRSAQAQPQVFVHRDYHSRNLMYCPDHNPGVLDFQDAVRGPVTYDLLSLLRDVYVRWPPERVAGWIRAYHDLASQHGVLREEHDLGIFTRWFDFMGAQRHLKIAGIFARLYHRDGKPQYLRDIPLTLAYLREEISPYPELAPLGALLDELRVYDRLEARNAEVFAQTRSRYG